MSYFFGSLNVRPHRSSEVTNLNADADMEERFGLRESEVVPEFKESNLQTICRIYPALNSPARPFLGTVCTACTLCRSDCMIITL